MWLLSSGPGLAKFVGGMRAVEEEVALDKTVGREAATEGQAVTAMATPPLTEDGLSVSELPLQVLKLR